MVPVSVDNTDNTDTVDADAVEDKVSDSQDEVVDDDMASRSINVEDKSVDDGTKATTNIEATAEVDAESDEVTGTVVDREDAVTEDVDKGDTVDTEAVEGEAGDSETAEVADSDGTDVVDTKDNNVPDDEASSRAVLIEDKNVAPIVEVDARDGDGVDVVGTKDETMPKDEVAEVTDDKFVEDKGVDTDTAKVNAICDEDDNEACAVEAKEETDASKAPQAQVLQDDVPSVDANTDVDNKTGRGITVLDTVGDKTSDKDEAGGDSVEPKDRSVDTSKIATEREVIPLTDDSAVSKSLQSTDRSRRLDERFEDISTASSNSTRRKIFPSAYDMNTYDLRIESNEVEEIEEDEVVNLLAKPPQANLFSCLACWFGPKA